MIFSNFSWHFSIFLSIIFQLLFHSLGHFISSTIVSGNSNSPQYFTVCFLAAAPNGGGGVSLAVALCVCSASRRNEREARENAVMTLTRRPFSPSTIFPMLLCCRAALLPSRLTGRVGWFVPKGLSSVFRSLASSRLSAALLSLLFLF